MLSSEDLGIVLLDIQIIHLCMLNDCLNCCCSQIIVKILANRKSRQDILHRLHCQYTDYHINQYIQMLFDCMSYRIHRIEFDAKYKFRMQQRRSMKSMIIILEIYHLQHMLSKIVA